MEPALEAILYTAGESGVTLGELAGILEISESAMRQQLDAYRQRLAAWPAIAAVCGPVLFTDQTSVRTCNQEIFCRAASCGIIAGCVRSARDYRVPATDYPD